MKNKFYGLPVCKMLNHTIKLHIFFLPDSEKEQFFTRENFDYINDTQNFPPKKRMNFQQCVVKYLALRTALLQNRRNCSNVYFSEPKERFKKKRNYIIASLINTWSNLVAALFPYSFNRLRASTTTFEKVVSVQLSRHLFH